MSIEQRQTLDAIVRQSSLPVGSDVDEQRRLFREAVSAQPLPADVTVTAAALDGANAEITVDGIEPRHVVLYFHGGVYVISDAFLAAGLASEIGRRTQAKVDLPSTTGSLPSTPTRQRLTTRLLPMKPSLTKVSPRRTSPSRETLPAPGSRSPPWSTPAITVSPCPPRRS